MLIDANSVEGGSVLRAKYCVIGSGMGGAALAQHLAAARQDVLLVEAGGLQMTDSVVTAEHVGRSFNMPLTRCIELGGSSNQWHGICAPLDAIDFEQRDWIEGSGWPITRQQLDPYYGQAANVLGLAGYDSNGTHEKVKHGLKAIDYVRSVLDPKIAYVRRSPRRWKSMLIEKARANEFNCLINASALELVTGGDGGQVDHLVVGAAGAKRIIRADVFVVCCGGLETPRLLLNSRRPSGAALGNEHDLVGRHLMDHPAGHFCKIRFRRDVRASLYSGSAAEEGVSVMAGLMLTAEQQRTHQLPNHYVWLRPSVSPARLDDELMLSFLKVRGVRDLTFRQALAILTNRDILYRVLVHRFGIRPKYRYGDLWFMTEQLPNPNSRVRLSAHRKDPHGYAVASIDWQLSAVDLERFHAYAKLLFQSGLHSDQYSLARIDDPEIWSRTVASAAHHLGTARMADHPSRGVIDAKLQVFGVSNLFVCDASVFPTAGSVNPSLTITALALRLGEHLLASNTPGLA